MESPCEKGKQVPKDSASWFEFLFDTTGELLKKHLGDTSAEPSAAQLIVQFLKHSVPQTVNLRAQQLCRLALRVAAYLQWNLEFLEENLSLHWQDFLLGELMKTAPSLEGVLPTEIVLSKHDQKTAMTLVIYYRWVVRTVAQHFLPCLDKPANNGLSSEEQLTNENILRKLEEQLPTAIHVLEQAVKFTDDMELPSAPSLIPEPKKQDCKAEEKTSNETPPANEGEDGGTIEGSTGGIKVDSKDGVNNGISDCNGHCVSTQENIEPCTEVGERVTKEDIVAQVSFDLGTLYFYQEKFAQAKRMFESCKSAKCSKSSFYTVDEKKLSGYCMACGGDFGQIPESGTSLALKLECCRQSGYKDLVQLLIEDNLRCELPLEVRDNLITEVHLLSKRINDDDDDDGDIECMTLEWQVMVCNTIREIIDGRPVKLVFWISLKSCSKTQLESVLNLCLQSVPVTEDTIPQTVKDSSRFRVLKSFAQLILCHCDQVNGWEIARNAMAKVFLTDEEEMMVDEERDSNVGTKRETSELIPVDVLGSREVLFGEDSPELKKGLLYNRLRHTFDPDEISSIIEQLHQLEKGKQHSEEFSCLLYKSHLEEIKNLRQNDILHIIFSKAMQCSALQEYSKVSQLLSYALGMVNSVSSGRGASGGQMDRVKSAIHQELLVLDISQESNQKRTDELSNRAKMYIRQTAPGVAELHVDEQVTAFLLNGKEWEFLSDLKVDENAQSIDHRSLSSLLASTCYVLSKPQGWRKPARSLWDGMLKIFSCTGQQKRPADGSHGVMVTRTADGMRLSELVKFVRKSKEETVLTVVISCLVRLHNASCKDDESDSKKEISSTHSHLWPTTITNASNVNFNHIGLALSGIVHHAISVQHHNTSWLQTIADIYLESGNYSSALRYYLESGAVSSSFFNSPVPSSVWDDQIFRKMVTCFSALKAHMQSALLCQCMEVKDYTTAFKALQQASLASSDAMDFYYPFFWDMTMLEYLVYIHAKRGQNEKKQLAVQAISQPELNIFNTSELLQHTEQSRKAKLFRTLAKQYL